METRTRQQLIDNYRDLFRRHGSGPEAAQLSAEGQRFRFEKLTEIAPLSGHSILDVGCNVGDLYPFLRHRFIDFKYTGIDIVPEIIEHAAKTHPEARFLCADLAASGLPEQFDYVLISGIFNNAVADCTAFLKETTAAAFSHCRKGLAFNFISTYVNSRDSDMAYHDPQEILGHCINGLSWKVTMQHHYERCDVAVFVYR